MPGERISCSEDRLWCATEPRAATCQVREYHAVLQIKIKTHWFICGIVVRCVCELSAGLGSGGSKCSSRPEPLSTGNCNAWH